MTNLTIAETCRRLFAQNKTDEQVWKVIQKKFNLDETKRGYPAAYRKQEQRRLEKQLGVGQRKGGKSAQPVRRAA